MKRLTMLVLALCIGACASKQPVTKEVRVAPPPTAQAKCELPRPPEVEGAVVLECRQMSDDSVCCQYAATAGNSPVGCLLIQCLATIGQDACPSIWQLQSAHCGVIGTRQQSPNLQKEKDKEGFGL